jgi:hypothetical protein
MFKYINMYLSTSKLFDLFILRVISAMFPYARMVELKKKGESWGMHERFNKFSIFIVLLPIAEAMQWHVLLYILGFVFIVLMFFTIQKDKLGLKLTRKFHNFLRSLNALVTELVLVRESSKVLFRSATLPIALPPPRRFA